MSDSNNYTSVNTNNGNAVYLQTPYGPVNYPVRMNFAPSYGGAPVTDSYAANGNQSLTQLLAQAYARGAAAQAGSNNLGLSSATSRLSPPQYALLADNPLAGAYDNSGGPLRLALNDGAQDASSDLANRNDPAPNKASESLQGPLDRVADGILNGDSSSVVRQAALIAADAGNGSNVRALALRLMNHAATGASKSILQQDLKNIEASSGKKALGDRRAGAGHSDNASWQMTALGKALAEQNWGEVGKIASAIRDDDKNSPEVKKSAKLITDALDGNKPPEQVSERYRDLVNLLQFRQG